MFIATTTIGLLLGAVPNPPLLHLTFDGTLDSADGVYSGIPTGDPGFTAGPCGQAASFDGIDDWIRLPHGGELQFDLDTQSYTLAVWTYTEIPEGNSGCIVQDRFDSNGSVSYNLCVNEDGLGAGIWAYFSNSWWGQPGNQSIEVGAPANDLFDGWHHLIVTYDHMSGVKTMYVDGVVASSNTRPAASFDTSGNTSLTIGAYAGDGFGNYFKGAIDDLRIYDRVISTTEIRALSGYECIADHNLDGVVDIFDVLMYLADFQEGCD